MIASAGLVLFRPLNIRRLKLVVCQEQPLRALRANLVFGTDEKRIRTKNKVLEKSNTGSIVNI